MSRNKWRGGGGGGWEEERGKGGLEVEIWKGELEEGRCG